MTRSLVNRAACRYCAGPLAVEAHSIPTNGSALPLAENVVRLVLLSEGASCDLMKFRRFCCIIPKVILALAGIFEPTVAGRLGASVQAVEPVESAHPPRFPSRLEPATPSRAALLKATAVVSGFSLRTTNREESRQFFNQVYQASENISPAWTGSLTTGDPGTDRKSVV